MFTVESKDVDKVALKLHRQFGHPTADKLVDLVHKAGCQDKLFIDAVLKVTKDCVTCCKFGKAPPRPVVSLPMSSKFNETISMDLKSYKGKYFIVIVDLATRYCGASVISDKNPSTIIRAVFGRWISIFGTPKKILSDNGGEFNNRNFQDMCEQCNIRVICTSAESAFSNGVCERLNAVLGNTVDKIMSDSGCDVHMALAWAVSARNSLLNNFGFSPNQLVFGFNPSNPCVENSDPPAMEQPKAVIVEKNLRAMRIAKEEFLKKDSNERLKRALKHNVRENKASDVVMGDHVFYKRKDSNEWRGPGSVIGREGSQILVRHGGMIVRVNAVSLKKSPKNISNQEVVLPQEELKNPERGTLPSAALEDESEESNSLRCMDNANIEVEPNDLPSSEETIEGEGGVSSDDAEEFFDTRDGPKTVCCPENIKIGDRISGIHKNTGELITGTVISRAGKASGKYRDCYNVEKSDGSVDNFNLKRDFEGLDKISDDREMLVFYTSDAVSEAKQCEIDNWLANEVFEEVEECNQQVISLRWVITEKLSNEKKVIKARLVARGFEEDTQDLRKDSPTCSREAVRLTISLASSKGWKCHTLDVRAAYLQGNSIQRDIFVKPPPEFDDGKI